MFHNKLRITTLIISALLLASAGCGKDGFSPEDAVLADYLPLQPGHSLKYSFSLAYSGYYESCSGPCYTSHTVKGSCEISFTDLSGQKNLTYKKISSLYHFEQDVLDNRYPDLPPGQDSHEEKNNYDGTYEYALAQSADELMYVTDSLDFSSIDENSTRKRMLNYSKRQGGLYDLTPFVVPGWGINPWDSKVEVKGDSLIYRIDVYTDAYEQKGAVKLVRNLGIASIDFYTRSGIPGSLSGASTTQIKYTRLEE